jgi:hypothetical protein
MAAAGINQRGKATDSCSPVENDGVLIDEEDSNPSLVTSRALIGWDPDQEVVQEKGTRESGQMATVANQRGPM